jgi:circadian clock protein KaiC
MVRMKPMRVSTGIEGLDRILCGGLLSGRSYLVAGEPGTGKTTLGLHFLTAGEGGLLITFGQCADQIRSDAASIGLSLDKVQILDLSPTAEAFSEIQTYDIFTAPEVEREPISQLMSTTIDGAQPRRIFVDSFGHFRNLAGDAFQHRRFAQSFFRFATRNGATLMVASEERSCAHDVDGVIELGFSPEGRRLHVVKFRGSDFKSGSHPMRLSAAGLQVTSAAA